MTIKDKSSDITTGSIHQADRQRPNLGEVADKATLEMYTLGQLVGEIINFLSGIVTICDIAQNETLDQELENLLVVPVPVYTPNQMRLLSNDESRKSGVNSAYRDKSYRCC